MRRWTCPTCGSGVLAPDAPRKDDARRYCLDCTARTGRLVQRACPALELNVRNGWQTDSEIGRAIAAAHEGR